MIDRERTLANAARYLGMRSPADGGELLLMAMDEAQRLARPKHMLKRVSAVCDNATVTLEGLPPIESAMLRGLFEGADEGLIALITLGADIDMRVRALMVDEPAQGVSLNACAGAYADALLDERLCEYSRELQPEGLTLTGRVSPGYGDLPLELQPSILKLLRADRIGVCLTGGLMMLPEKSITAIAAIVKAGERGRGGRGCDGSDGCDGCSRKDCPYRGGASE